MIRVPSTFQSAHTLIIVIPQVDNIMHMNIKAQSSSLQYFTYNKKIFLIDAFSYQ